MNKKRWITIRVSEVLFRKLMAICRSTGKTKTEVVRNLIDAEYGKNKKYEKWYYEELNKEME